MLRILAAAFAAVLALAGSAQAQTVTTKSGAVEGATSSGVSSWKGIPFAAPPVGDLRWMPPQPAARWEGVKSATRIGPACPQPERGDGGGVGAPPAQSEDCLTLNVYAPAGAKNLPVMVWIYGGAFRVGYSGAPLYDGAEFARRGVILVTVNYRLGLLGFLAHPALTAAAKPGEPIGNYGLMDQIAGLQWVKDNIAAFGGDPANVTVFGESAGGSSVIYLLANPKAKGLFAKAIVESGGGTQRPVTLKDNEQRGLGYAKTIGLEATATLAEMRARPASDWIKAQGAVAGGGLGFGPFIDGRFITEAPWQAFAAGRAADVPLIIGANSNEASVLATLGAPAGGLAALGPRMGELKTLYGPGLSDQEFTRQLMGDAIFVAPSRWIASAASGGAPSYLYYFPYVASVRREAAPGANHGSEIPYVFGTWRETPLLARVMSAQDRAMSETLQSCWVSFAKTGKPACAGAPAWPAYDPKTDQMMEFGTTVAVKKVPKAAAFDLLTAGFPLKR